METTTGQTANIEADEQLVDETGHFHAHDAPIDLSAYPFEAWIAFGFFWLLAADIFYQFFTRYALNSSASWTEEIARYLLICVVFIALAWAVRDERHIHVDIFYRLLPAPVCRVLATLVDVVRMGEGDDRAVDDEQRDRQLAVGQQHHAGDQRDQIRDVNQRVRAENSQHAHVFL